MGNIIKAEDISDTGEIVARKPSEGPEYQYRYYDRAMVKITIGLPMNLLRKYNIPEWEFKRWMASSIVGVHTTVPSEVQSHL